MWPFFGFWILLGIRKSSILDLENKRRPSYWLHEEAFRPVAMKWLNQYSRLEIVSPKNQV
jgi:hypothetical protein